MTEHDHRVGAEIDFIVKRGDTANIVFTLDVDGTPVNITDYTAKFTVKRDASSTTALIQKTTSDGITLSDPTNGELTVALEPADTASLPAGTYRYDLELTSPAGVVTTYAWGKFVIDPDIS